MRITQKSMTAALDELTKLMVIFPGLATTGWLRQTALYIWQICEAGPADFCGPDVLAWWLVQRCQPKEPLTKARVRKLQRMCGGSQKSMDILVAIAQERSKPARLGCGWDFIQVNSYLAQLMAERAR